MSERILVVDDDIQLTTTLGRVLRESGYDPLLAYTAEDGLRLAETQRPDLAVLDVMVPAMGGWEMCHKIRLFSDMPIIFLTALGDVTDVVRGLETGADDYLVKPFRQPELLARIKAQLRRAPENLRDQRLVFGDDELIIDLLAHTVTVRGEEVDLTPREFELLATLAKDAGRVLSLRELLRRAWDMDYNEAKDNIKPYIHYLRKKIEEDPAAPRWIVTVRGVGYRFADQ
jgi:DNA-binding response OmpR family regulator